MKLKYDSFGLLVLAFLTSMQLSKSALAENNICKDDARCLTAGGTAAVATGAGINSAKKFARADLFEKQNTKIGFQLDPDRNGELKPNELDRYGQLYYVEDGARVTIFYNLNPSENRDYHIQSEQSLATSAHSSESYHRTMSFTASKTVYEYDSKGRMTGSHQEADFAMRVYHASESSRYAGIARGHELEIEITLRDSNHKVPLYELNKVIGADEDLSQKVTLDFLEERTQHESKVLRIEVLQKQAKHALAKMTSKAVRTAAFAGILFTGAAAEAMTGYAAQQIEEKGSGLEIKVGIDDFFGDENKSPDIGE
jgi:hypothetical protein